MTKSACSDSKQNQERFKKVFITIKKKIKTSVVWATMELNYSDLKSKFDKPNFISTKQNCC